MRAAVLHGRNDLRLETDVMRPRAATGEVLVRVRSAGICGSDVAEFTRGPLMTRQNPGTGRIPPVILGHEFAGEVVAVGDNVTGFVPGAAVVCGAGISCGTCRPCRHGRTNLCDSYTTLGYHRPGGLAEFCAVPANILYDASSYFLSMDTLGMAQPMAIASHCVSRSGLRAGDLAVIVGAGGIGAFLTYAAMRTGAEVWVTDIDPRRLLLARSLGAHRVLDAREAALDDALRDTGRRADVLFEVSGTRTGLEGVLQAAQPGATIVPVGVQKTELSLALGPWTLREYTVVGSNAHVFGRDIPLALELLASRASGWTDVANEIRTLEEIVAAGLQPEPLDAHRPIKLLVDPAASSSRPAHHYQQLVH